MKRLILLSMILLFGTYPLFPQLSGWKKLIDEPTYGVSVNPQNPNTIFVGGEGRVIYRSYDAGLSWDTVVVGYRGGTALLNNILIHPIDTNVVICGGLMFGDVRRTINHGNNKDDWVTVLKRSNNICLDGKALVMKPDDPNILFIGDYTSGNVYKSQDRGITWDTISTILAPRKVRDNAEDPYRDTIMPVNICSIYIREDSTNIILATSNYAECFISTDGGYNWKITATLINPQYWKDDGEFPEIEFSKRDPRVGYGIVCYLSPINTPNGGLFKTTDGGYNWDLIAFADTSFFTLAVTTNESGDNDEIFVGGYTEHFYTINNTNPGLGIVRRSTDGGVTWQSYDESIDWKNENIDYLTSLNSICLVKNNPLYLFSVGDKSTILKTENNGWFWNKPDSVLFSETPDLNSVFFTDRNNGFAVGDNGTFAKAIVNGKKWYQQTSFTNKNLNSIFFIDSINGAICGDDGLIFITNDAGITWEEKHSSNNYNLKSVYFVDNNIGFAAGESTFLKTIDAGNNWTETYSVNELNINEIHFISADTGFAVGDKSVLLKTTDCGNSWDLSSFNGTTNLHSVCFTGSLGYSVGDKGLILKTTNYGESWDSVNTSIKRDLYSVRFTDEDNILACGERNTILVSEDSGATWNPSRYNYGPRANVWAQEFFGENENKILYMASEAGFFVLDMSSPVIEDLNLQNMSDLNVYKNSQNSLFISYNRKEPNSELVFRIIDLKGKVAFSTNILSSSSVINETLKIPDISKGVYICQMLENNIISTKLVIID